MIDTKSINSILNSGAFIPETVGLRVLFCPETGFTRYGKTLKGLLSKYSMNPKLTYYTSYNTFSKFNHSDSSVLGLNALWLDFDCYNNEILVDTFESALPEIIELMELPKPNHVIMSGFGFHLVYFFSQPRITHSPRFTKLWCNLEKYIIKLGRKACVYWFGNPNICDSSVSNPSRLMRIAGSYNNKHNQHVLVRRVPEFESHELYPMQYYIDNYMPEIKYSTANKQRKTHKQFKKYLKHHKQFRGKHNSGTLNYERYYDLKHLISLRNGKCTGSRDFILFTIACQLAYIMTTANIIKCVELVNKLFNQPLPKKQMKDFTNEIKGTDFRGYKLHTNKYLIQRLQINLVEQAQLTTLKEAKHSTLIQHHLNHIKRMKYLKNRNKKIVQLHDNHFSNRKIAKLTKLSRSTVNRIIKNYKLS